MMDAVIDDLSRDFPLARNGAAWETLSDQVMGGVSSGVMTRESVAGKLANRLRGDVSLANNGGFVQMALDLDRSGAAVDGSGFTGIEIEIAGNDEEYGFHLRTAQLDRPWQSYRQAFRAEAQWRRLRLAFTGFVPHRTTLPLETRLLRRVGLVAIGRAFHADLALADIRFY